MRALGFEQHGGVEQVRLLDVPRPAIGPLEADTLDKAVGGHTFGKGAQRQQGQAGGKDSMAHGILRQGFGPDPSPGTTKKGVTNAVTPRFSVGRQPQPATNSPSDLIRA